MNCIIRRKSCDQNPFCKNELNCRWFNELSQHLDFAMLQLIAEYGHIAATQGLSVIDLQLKLRDIVAGK